MRCCVMCLCADSWLEPCGTAAKNMLVRIQEAAVPALNQARWLCGRSCVHCV